MSKRISVTIIVTLYYMTLPGQQFVKNICLAAKYLCLLPMSIHFRGVVPIYFHTTTSQNKKEKIIQEQHSLFSGMVKGTVNHEKINTKY